MIDCESLSLDGIFLVLILTSKWVFSHVNLIEDSDVCGSMFFSDSRLLDIENQLVIMDHDILNLMFDRLSFS